MLDAYAENVKNILIYNCCQLLGVFFQKCPSCLWQNITTEGPRGGVPHQPSLMLQYMGGFWGVGACNVYPASSNSTWKGSERWILAMCTQPYPILHGMALRGECLQCVPSLILKYMEGFWEVSACNVYPASSYSTWKGSEGWVIAMCTQPHPTVHGMALRGECLQCVPSLILQYMEWLSGVSPCHVYPASSYSTWKGSEGWVLAMCTQPHPTVHGGVLRDECLQCVPSLILQYMEWLSGVSPCNVYPASSYSTWKGSEGWVLAMCTQPHPTVHGRDLKGECMQCVPSLIPQYMEGLWGVGACFIACTLR